MDFGLEESGHWALNETDLPIIYTLALLVAPLFQTLKVWTLDLKSLDFRLEKSLDFGLEKLQALDLKIAWNLDLKKVWTSDLKKAKTCGLKKVQT